MESTLCRFHETAASSAFLPAGDIVEAHHDVQSFVILARGTLLESLDVVEGIGHVNRFNRSLYWN